MLCALQMVNPQAYLDSWDEVYLQICAFDPQVSACHDYSKYNYTKLQALLTRHASVEQFVQDIQTLISPTMSYLGQRT